MPRGVPHKPRACVCDWPGGCSGTGVEHCEGCDCCVCVCGGERDCAGCEMCEPEDRGDGVADNGP